MKNLLKPQYDLCCVLRRADDPIIQACFTTLTEKLIFYFSGESYFSDYILL